MPSQIENRGTSPEHPIFGMMQRLGNVDEKEMFRTFNMGIGMVVICSETHRDGIASQINDSYEIGAVIQDTGQTEIVMIARPQDA